MTTIDTSDTNVQANPQLKISEASSTHTLGHHAQEAVDLIAEYVTVPDAVSKLNYLIDLEKHLEDCRNLIEKERSTLECLRNQNVHVELVEFAEDAGFGSIDEMLKALGLVNGESPTTVKPPSTHEDANGQTSIPVDQQNVNKVAAQRNAYPQAPAVYQFKSTIDPTKGYTGSLRGAKGNWVKKHEDGKPDMKYFCESTADEIAEMQKLRDDYIKVMDAKREARAAKKQ